MIIKPTIAIWLDNRRAKKGNKYPGQKSESPARGSAIIIRLILILLKVVIRKCDECQTGSKVKRGTYKALWTGKTSYCNSQQNCEELHTEFTIELFEKYLNINTPIITMCFIAISAKLISLRKGGKFKTAEGYETGLQALKLFTGQKSPVRRSSQVEGQSFAFRLCWK